MKKLFLSLLVLCGLQANALEAADSLATATQKPVPADTLAVEALPSDSIQRFEQPDSVTIRQFDDHLQVNIFGEKDNPDFRYQYTHKTSADDEVTNSEWNFRIPFIDKSKPVRPSEHDFEMGGLGFGFVNALNAPQPMNVDMGNSYEIFFDALRFRWRPWRNGTSFSIGFGFSWRNFRMTGNTRFVQNDNTMGFDTYPENADVKFSRIKVFSLTLPVMFHQSFAKNFQFGCGAVVNFNTHASMKTVYKLNGEEHKFSTDNIHQRRATVDLMAYLKFKVLSLYVKYSPSDVLVNDFGPKFNSLSVGFILF